MIDVILLQIVEDLGQTLSKEWYYFLLRDNYIVHYIFKINQEFTFS